MGEDAQPHQLPEITGEGCQRSSANVPVGTVQNSGPVHLFGFFLGLGNLTGGHQVLSIRGAQHLHSFAFWGKLGWGRGPGNQAAHGLECKEYSGLTLGAQRSVRAVCWLCGSEASIKKRLVQSKDLLTVFPLPLYHTIT